MKFSFYRNLTWLIGILVAIEIYLEMGLHRGLVFMIADLLIVLLLTFLFHQLRSAGVSSGAFNPDSVSNVINTKSESEWQKKHDQWWQAYRQKTIPTSVSSAVTKPSRSSVKSSSSSSVNVNQLERSNRDLKNQIDHLNRKISSARDDQHRQDLSHQDSSWYQQVKQMKRQIEKLKSEYK